MATWQLLARMPDLTVGGILRGWALSATLKLNEVGTLRLEVPPEETPAGWPAPGCGLIVMRDNEVIASGMLDEESFAWSAGEDDATSGPGLYALTFDTDLGRLAYRVVYPSPTQPWEGTQGSYWKYPFDGTTSNAEDVLRVTVNYQAGSLAQTARRVPGVRLGTATGVGTQTRILERFTPLLDALRKTALAGGGLVFDVTDALDTGLDFTVRAPVDRTATARFGRELGNVTRLDILRIAPTATDALIGAFGEKDARELVEIDDPGAPAAWGRREVFVDQRQIDPDATADEKAAEYQKAADEAFASGGEQTSVAAVTLDTAAVAWGRDYNLGDKVSVITPYGPVADLVRQVDLTVTAEGVEDIASTIGSTAASTADPLADTVRRLTRRISQLERSL